MQISLDQGDHELSHYKSPCKTLQPWPKNEKILILLLKSLLMHKRIAIHLKLYNEYLMDSILKGIKENKLIVNIINLPDKPCYFYPVLFFQTMHYKDVV